MPHSLLSPGPSPSFPDVSYHLLEETWMHTLHPGSSAYLVREGSAPGSISPCPAWSPMFLRLPGVRGLCSRLHQPMPRVVSRRTRIHGDRRAVAVVACHATPRWQGCRAELPQPGLAAAPCCSQLRALRAREGSRERVCSPQKQMLLIEPLSSMPSRGMEALPGVQNGCQVAGFEGGGGGRGGCRGGGRAWLSDSARCPQPGRRTRAPALVATGAGKLIPLEQRTPRSEGPRVQPSATAGPGHVSASA